MTLGELIDKLSCMKAELGPSTSVRIREVGKRPQERSTVVQINKMHDPNFPYSNGVYVSLVTKQDS